MEPAVDKGKKIMGFDLENPLAFSKEQMMSSAAIPSLLDAADAKTLSVSADRQFIISQIQTWQHLLDLDPYVRYLAIHYADRFFWSSRRFGCILPDPRLLVAACFSLAAKFLRDFILEEPTFFQLPGVKRTFDRMKEEVHLVLQGGMWPVTPLAFVRFLVAFFPPAYLVNHREAIKVHVTDVILFAQLGSLLASLGLWQKEAKRTPSSSPPSSTSSPGVPTTPLQQSLSRSLRPTAARYAASPAASAATSSNLGLPRKRRKKD